MSDHERDRRPLFFGKRQELRCKIAHTAPLNAT